MKRKLLLSLRSRKRGSAVLAALGVLAVTSMLVGAALVAARGRYLTSHQSACWSQAGPAAEAGIELALMSAQNNSWVANGWSAAPGAPGTAAVTKSFPLSTGVAATGNITADVSVDKITLSGSDWLRVRSTGRANLSGGAVSGMDMQDVMLRKLSLRTDRVTGASLGTSPQATRTIEVLAEPATKSPFVRALLLDKKVTMTGSALVDSFDSGDTAKSTGGLYDPLKRTSNGTICINDTQGTTNLGGNAVYGNLNYGGAAPTGTGGVTGTITGSSNTPTSPVTAPTWTSFNATPTAITGTMTLTGGTQAAPARYKVSSLNLTGSNVLTVASHAAGAESYAEIWVTGDLKTTGSSKMVNNAGVHVTYHVAGNLDVSGSGFQNQTNIAANNIINLITPAAGVTQTCKISGSGTFIGALNAPAAAMDISGSGSFCGAFIAKTLVISGSGGVHYDEALSRMTGGTGSGFTVRSFVEGVR